MLGQARRSIAAHKISIEWAAKGVRKEDYVLPALRRMEKNNAFGVYFILKSMAAKLSRFSAMEQGRTFRITMPKYPTQDPNHRILAHQTSRFTHYYFYIRDETLGPIVMRVASFFPFHATYWLNGHSFIELELRRSNIGFRKNDNAFLAVDDVAALQAAADRLSPEIIRKQLDYWTLILGAEVLKKGTQPDEPVAVLLDHADRVLPEFHFQTALPDPQNLRTWLRDRPVTADGAPHQENL